MEIRVKREIEIESDDSYKTRSSDRQTEELRTQNSVEKRRHVGLALDDLGYRTGTGFGVREGRRFRYVGRLLHRLRCRSRCSRFSWILLNLRSLLISFFARLTNRFRLWNSNRWVFLSSTFRVFCFRLKVRRVAGDSDFRSVSFLLLKVLRTRSFFSLNWNWNWNGQDLWRAEKLLYKFICWTLFLLSVSLQSDWGDSSDSSVLLFWELIFEWILEAVVASVFKKDRLFDLNL